MRVRVGAATDIGRARERNEDAFLIDAPLFAVADGMGGHRAGDVASALALETLKPIVEAGDWDRLADRVQEANRVVFERAEGDDALSGMGTTLTAAVVSPDGAIRLVHVGDSRAYLFRAGKLSQLTQDHTLVDRLVREGKISEEEATTHPQRSILTRALGVEEEVDVDEVPVEVQPDDRVILCTDGLTGMMRAASIGEILETTREPQEAAERLVDAANRAGGLDNITVIVLDFIADGAEAAAAGEPSGESDTADLPAGGTPVEEDEEDEEEDDVGRIARRDDTGFVPVPADAALARSDEEARRIGRMEVEGRWVAGPKPPLVRRLFVWLLVAAVVGAAGWFGLSWYLDRQWYVGVAEGNVAIYNGIPTEVLGWELSDVDQVYEDLPAAEVVSLGQWGGLEEGITAEDRAHAERIVQQIRDDLEERAAQGGG